MSNLQKLRIPPLFNMQLVISKIKTALSVENLSRHCLRNLSTFETGTLY